MGLRMTVNSKKIIEEAQIQGYSTESIKRSIMALVLKNEIQELNQGKFLKRIR